MKRQSARSNGFLSTIGQVLAVFAIFFVIFTLLNPSAFFNAKNFATIAKYSAFTGIITVGMVFVIIGGEIDLSMGAIMGLVCMIEVYFMPEGGNILGVIGISLVVGLLCGLLNGALVSFLRLPSFVVTLASAQLFKGLGSLIFNGPTATYYNKAFIAIGKGMPFDVPTTFLYFVGLLLLGALVLKFTVYGRNVYAVGCNASASRFAGINVKRSKLSVFLISGVLSAVAAMLATSVNYSGYIDVGEDCAMDAIAAAVLGGVSLSGGKGNIIGAFFGVMLLRMITNGLNLMNVATYWQMVIRGTLLIVAVVVDSMRNSRD